MSRISSVVAIYVHLALLAGSGDLNELVLACVIIPIVPNRYCTTWNWCECVLESIVLLADPGK